MQCPLTVGQWIAIALACLLFLGFVVVLILIVVKHKRNAKTRATAVAMTTVVEPGVVVRKVRTGSDRPWTGWPADAALLCRRALTPHVRCTVVCRPATVRLLSAVHAAVCVPRLRYRLPASERQLAGHGARPAGAGDWLSAKPAGPADPTTAVARRCTVCKGRHVLRTDDVGAPVWPTMRPARVVVGLPPPPPPGRLVGGPCGGGDGCGDKSSAHTRAHTSAGPLARCRLPAATAYVQASRLRRPARIVRCQQCGSERVG